MKMIAKLMAVAGCSLFTVVICGCTAGESGENKQGTAASDQSVMSNQKRIDKPVRVIVTLANGDDVEEARTSLMRAGASLAEPIEGQPVIVVEALRSQLDVGLQGVEVKSVQADSLSPTN